MSLVFFTDRDLGNIFPSVLREAGLSVERHSDHFPHDCADEEWLRAVGERGWIAVTHDQRIRYKPNELAAVVRHRVTLLVVIGKVPLGDLAASFVATVPKIEKLLSTRKPPIIVKVYRSSSSGPGELTIWYASSFSALDA